MPVPHADIGTAIREVNRDFATTSLVSLLLVATIVAVAMRNVVGLLVLLPPLLLANILTISLVSLIFGSVNLYTSMGGAIVFGLGIDFGIHLVARYREELGRGISRAEAVCSAWSQTGPPCTTAALTSAAGFLMFLVAEFGGMRQLGVLLALGVLLSLTMMLLVLPLLLTRIPLVARTPARAPAVPRRYRIGAALTVIAVCVALLPSVSSLRVDYDVSAIKSEGLAWDELTDQERQYRQNAFPPVHLSSGDRSALHRELDVRITRGDFDYVRGVLSVDSVLPPDQDERLDALAGLIQTARNPLRDFASTELKSVLVQIGELDTAPVSVADLPEGFAHLLGVPGDQVLLLPQGNMLDLRLAEGLVQELEDYADIAASGFFVAAALGRVLTHDLPLVAMLALLTVLVIIVVDLRRPAVVVIAVASLALGIVWAMSALAAVGIPINIVNVVALPMLLGIGVDIIVHLLHRLRTGSSLGLTLRTTGVAVLLSTLTTIAAFVSLTAADHRGLQSIGLVILMGLTAMLVAALLVVTSGSTLLADKKG